MRRTTREITESLLEMAYFQPFREMFESVFGVQFLKVMKYSTNDEAFVGFDQGWARIRASRSEVFEDLRKAIATGASSAPTLHFGYFMQFKLMRQRVASSAYTPPGWSCPYFECDVDLVANTKTGRSQHETLCALALVNGAEVHYACPLIETADELFDSSDTLLSKLTLVSPASAPPSWPDGSNHRLLCRVPSSGAVWMSDPMDAATVPVARWFEAASPAPAEAFLSTARSFLNPPQLEPVGLTLWTFAPRDTDIDYEPT